MRSSAKWTLIAFATTLVLFVAFRAWKRADFDGARARAARNYSVAPDFILPQLDGKPLKLSSYRGKIVLLDFWATWCDPCREETPHFEELQQSLGERGLQIVGVSMDDSPEPVKAFYEQFHMNYPVVMGNAKIGEMYGGVLGLPIVFVIDRKGRVRSKHVGATDAATYRKEIEELLEGE